MILELVFLVAVCGMTLCVIGISKLIHGLRNEFNEGVWWSCVGLVLLLLGVLIAGPNCSDHQEQIPYEETIEMCLEYKSCDHCYNKFSNTNQKDLFEAFIRNGKCKPTFQGGK